MAEQVWFWQRIVSAHMAELAKPLAKGREVIYVAERALSASRAATGWIDTGLGEAQLCFTPDAERARALALSATPSSIHICKGLRGNGLMGVASSDLARRLLRRWGVMETIEDLGWKGRRGRLEYRRLLLKEECLREGKLASGSTTPDWLVAKGIARMRIFLFAYFLPEGAAYDHARKERGPVPALLEGQMIHCERVDLLIDVMTTLARNSAMLAIVGLKTPESELRQRGKKRGLNIRRLYTKLMVDVYGIMVWADCLVIPSRHDGWGAAVSEAKRREPSRSALMPAALTCSYARAMRAVSLPPARCSRRETSLSQSRSGEPT